MMSADTCECVTFHKLLLSRASGQQLQLPSVSLRPAGLPPAQRGAHPWMFHEGPWPPLSVQHLIGDPTLASQAVPETVCSAFGIKLPLRYFRSSVCCGVFLLEQGRNYQNIIFSPFRWKNNKKTKVRLSFSMATLSKNTIRFKKDGNHFEQHEKNIARVICFFFLLLESYRKSFSPYLS